MTRPLQPRRATAATIVAVGVTADPEPEVARDNAAAAGQFLRANEPAPSSSPRSVIGQFLLTNGPSSTSSQQGGAGRGRARTTPAWMTAGGGRDDTPRPIMGRGRGDADRDNGRGGGTTRL